MNNLPPRSNKSQKNENNSGQNIRIMALIGLSLVAVLLLMMFSPFAGGQDTISLNKLADRVQAGEVQSIIVRDDTRLAIQMRDKSQHLATKEQNVDLLKLLEQLGVDKTKMGGFEYRVETSANTAILFNILITLVPMVIIGWIVWRTFRQMRIGQDQALNFGRSRARVSRDMERPMVTFGDVAGVEEAKNDLKEIVEFLKEPDKFIQLGARIPKGVLMVGPPGTGKTLLARAVAGEAGAPFFSISGSEFVEMFVGVGASRVRDLFDRAKAEAPAIVFVDEIDAVGRHRGAGLGGGHDEREQTLNQILVEMDGFDNNTNVIVVAATNRPDVLDPALLRPGRFDRKVVLDRPDRGGRRAILDVHIRGKPLSSDVDLDVLAKITPGFVGADLENLVNEAAILAARRNKKAISMREMQESMERVVAGPERRSHVISPQEKRVVAYHEGGHAVTMHFVKHGGPVHKVTIVPRGQALGYAMPLPEEDQFLQSKAHFEDQIVSLLGGRVAEEMTFESITNGASNDIERCTRLARTMVTRFGMSEKLGLRTFGEPEGAVFLGRDLGERRDYSEEMAAAIDAEVAHIIETCYQRTRDILTTHKDKLEAVAQALLDQESLDREAFETIMGAAPAEIAARV